jgi:hypothetical protein
VRRPGRRSAAGGGVRLEESKAFFFEKKNQKTFMTFSSPCAGNIARTRDPNGQKFFASFFKKEGLSFLPCLFHRTHEIS